MEKPVLIEKEELINESFPSDDVLKDKAAKEQRRNDLQHAMRFGNNEKGKIALVFDTQDNETKRVETTVWSVTENNVLLKKGITLPIRAIREINLYPVD